MSGPAASGAVPVRAGSVRAVLRPLLVALAVAVVVLGGLGVSTAVVAQRSTARLVDDALPALTAHDRVLQSLTDAETSLRAWALTGEQELLEPYEAGRSRLPEELAVVRAYAADDPELRAGVDALEAAARAWLRDYADVRVERGGGVVSFDPALFRVGRDRFEALRREHAAVGGWLAADVRDVDADTDRAVLALLGAIVVLGLAVAALGAAAARRLVRRVVVPLGAVGELAHTLAAAPDAPTPRLLPGPASEGTHEVQAVAAALDELAEAQARARAVADALAAEQRALDHARHDFVSNVSHELRTPLTTIAGYLEVAEEELDGRLDDRQQRMLDATVRNVDRLRLLIDDILTLSRVEAAGTDLETVPVADVVRDVVDDLRTAASRRGIEVATALADADDLLVLADRAQLSRALLNLVSNAVKFSREGGVVEVVAHREPRDVVVEVRDQGIGIPAADLPSLGTRFFRAGNAVSEAVPGTGLGLRIVQSIVGHHGGTMAVASVEGEGTTVTVRLPAQAQR